MKRRTAFRQGLMVAAGATALTAMAAPAAMAAEGWCDIDPVQLVITSGRNLVPVFVTNGASSALYVAQLLLAKITHTVESVDGGTASLVTVKVTVPNALLGKRFETRTKITSGPIGLLKLYGTATGWSGNTMTVQFKLSVA